MKKPISRVLLTLVASVAVLTLAVGCENEEAEEFEEEDSLSVLPQIQQVVKSPVLPSGQ